MPTVSYQITDTADDATDTGALGGLSATQVTNGIAFGMYTLIAGLRFLGVAVPKGATITAATLELKKSATQQFIGTNHGRLRGAAVDNIAVWSASNSPATVTKTTESVVVADAATVAYDVKAIVQAIVNRAGWTSGNALAFVGDPTGADGALIWVDYGASPADAAKLSITYETGGGPTARATFQAMIIG